MRVRFRFAPASGCHAGWFVFALVLVLPVALMHGGQGQAPAPADTMTVDQVMAMPKIDAHAHVGPMSGAQRTAFLAFLEKASLKWLNICTGGMNAARLAQQIENAEQLHRAAPGRVAWATSFTLSNWGDEDWAEAAERMIDEGFSGGAVAAKVWKDLGMELKDADGRFVMADDPRVSPVFSSLAGKGRTLVAHLGEPRNCWLPLDQMTTASDRGYFSRNPQYHGYLLPEMPGYEKQIAARDAVLERHPRLRMVGCHLASLEYDVDEVAKRLDKYPNLAVDLAARMVHLQIQPREKVRSFVLRYQDRILYGTDFAFGRGSDDPAATAKALASLEADYRSDAAYLATDREVDVPRAREGFKSRGLALPASVLRKIYFENAKKWYPGI